MMRHLPQPYTRSQASAIYDRAMSFGLLTGGQHGSVRIAAAGVMDHIDGWEGFAASSDELDEALEPVFSVYADLLRSVAA